jgi:hypothetical protein
MYSTHHKVHLTRDVATETTMELPAMAGGKLKASTGKLLLSQRLDQESCIVLNSLLGHTSLCMIASVRGLGTFEVMQVAKSEAKDFIDLIVYTSQGAMPLSVRWHQEFQIYLNRESMLEHWQEVKELV